MKKLSAKGARFFDIRASLIVLRLKKLKKRAEIHRKWGQNDEKWEKNGRKSYKSMKKSGKIIDFLARDWAIFNVVNYDSH